MLRENYTGPDNIDFFLMSLKRRKDSGRLQDSVWEDLDVALQLWALHKNARIAKILSVFSRMI